MSDDELIALEVLVRLNESKARLLAEMARFGLTPEQGWRIMEGLRTHATGHEFVFYPIHTHLDFEGLEVTVRIGNDGRLMPSADSC